MQPLQGKGHVPKLSSRTKMVSFEAMYRSEIKKKKKKLTNESSTQRGLC